MSAETIGRARETRIVGRLGQTPSKNCRLTETAYNILQIPARSAPSLENIVSNEAPALEPLFCRRAFARALPFVFGAPHLDRHSESAVVAPMALRAG